MYMYINGVKYQLVLVSQKLTNTIYFKIVCVRIKKNHSQVWPTINSRVDTVNILSLVEYLENTKC